MTEALQKTQLAFLEDIYRVSLACGTKTYIWAGFVPDVIQGKFLREHKDIDGFTLNLWDLRQMMHKQFSQRGFAITYLEDVNFMRVERNGVHATFNGLEIDGDTAMWRHAGNDGTVFFPAAWLAEQPYEFYGVRVYVSGIELEYCIKTYPELLSPIWKGRDKDLKTLEWLTATMKEKGTTPTEVVTRIWSCNPYWAKKGYSEYEKPIVPSQRA